MFEVVELEKELQTELDKQDQVGEVAGIIISFIEEEYGTGGIVPMKVMYAECCKKHSRDFNRPYFISVVSGLYATFKNPDDAREMWVDLDQRI